MATTWIYRQPSSDGSNTTYTYSLWLKRSSLGATERIISNGNQNAAGSKDTQIVFQADNSIMWDIYNDGATVGHLETDRVFRDTLGWFHLMFIYNSTSATTTITGTATDRMQVWVNGVQESALNTITVPAQNAEDPSTNDTGYKMRFGSREGTQMYFGGSMSHIHFSDGTVYGASTFGSTDATTGEWKIKTSPSFTLGTNGFTILKDGNTITDQSSNSNAFTLGGGTLTNTEDCPSDVYATFNPLDDYYAGSGFANGNTQINTASGGHEFNVSTLGMNKGKFYWECKIVQATAGGNDTIGISDHSYRGSSQELSEDNYSYAYIGGGSTRGNGSTLGGTWASYGAGDIITVALDVDNNKLYFGKDGVWQNSGDPTSGATGTGAISIQDLSAVTSDYGQGVYFFAAGDWHDSASGIYAGNFGNGYFATTAITSEGTNASNIGKFEYDVPTGYTALCTKGLNE